MRVPDLKESMMSNVDSPIGRCEEAHAMVLTDQTQEQCAFEHECPRDRVCPLAGCFAEFYMDYRKPCSVVDVRSSRQAAAS